MAHFRVILDSVDAANFDPVLDELLLQFPLERPNAEQILRQAPIVLLDQLSAEEADNVRTNLVKLTRLGAKIRVTTASAGTAKRLTWPVIPALARRPGNLFICPHCGERFVVQAWKAPQPETARPPVETAPTEPEAAQAKPEPAEEVPVAAPAAAAPSNRPLGIAPKDEEVPVLEPKSPAKAPKSPAETPTPPAPVPPVPAPSAKPAAKAPASQPADRPPKGGPRFRVSVRQRLTGKSRKRAAELVVKFQKISAVKAARVVGRSLFTVLKDATEEEAEACRREFKDAGISVRVVEAK